MRWLIKLIKEKYELTQMVKKRNIGELKLEQINNFI